MPCEPDGLVLPAGLVSAGVVPSDEPVDPPGLVLPQIGQVLLLVLPTGVLLPDGLVVPAGLLEPSVDAPVT